MIYVNIMAHKVLEGKSVGFQKEYFLNTASAHSIWNQISTARGLSEWFAPKVDITQDLIHIFWDDQGDDRVATINKRIPNKLIEWRWNDDPESYIRMEIVTSELSKSTSLMVNDHDKGLETESLEQIWMAHEERLFASLGIL